MDKLGDFITIEEAAEVTNKSISTIRRFVATHKHSKNDIIRVDVNERNRPLYRINKKFIIAYFETNKKNEKDSDTSTDTESSKKELIKKLLY